MAGWKEKLLSKAGKEVLIQAVTQAILTYSMSCFKIPDSLCDEMTSLIRNFWWGQRKDERKMAWISRDKLCAPKANRGLGFKQLKQFNLALLAKQELRLQVGSDSLVYRVFKVRSFPNSDFVPASMGRNPSHVWRNILVAQEVVKKGIRWQVGNGNRIGIWRDKWLPTPSIDKVVSPSSMLPLDVTMDVLIDVEVGEWKKELVQWH